MFSGQIAARDTLQFSLLTCAPGEQVYELFGHTAIRCRNLTTGMDVVFNYGVFDFNAPNFVMRFVRGETDYQLGVVPYPYFEYSYRERGSGVVEQQLALTESEASRLMNMLQVNYLPQNRVYRYNYFYDNCTTRARDCIERALDSPVVYHVEADSGMTFRSWIKLYTEGHPWADFGINLCLGAEADTPIDARMQMFLPDNLQKAFAGAVIQDSVGRKLLSGEREIFSSSGKNISPVGEKMTPMQVAFSLLILVVVSCWIEYRRRRVWWGIDLVLFFLQGVAGCVIAFLFFFSVHPTVGSNWLLIFLNPLPLLFLPITIRQIRKGEKSLFDKANIAVLTLFILFLPLIPQKISLVIVPLALILLLRSLLHLLVVRARKGDTVLMKFGKIKVK